MWHILFQISNWIQNLGWVTAINSSDSGSGIVEVVHYFSMFMIVGPTAMVDFRLLGITRHGQTAGELAKMLFPLTWWGFVINAITGLIMTAGSATMYYDNHVMGVKVLIIILAVIANVIIQRNAGNWDRMPSIPAGAKFVAFLSIALWLGAILAGVEVPAITGVG
jgi:hypothetical protein